MSAVVLAAGYGRRMGPLTAEIPKCLLEIRPGVSLLDNILIELSALQVSQVTVVGGHGFERLRDAIHGTPSKLSCSVSLIRNEHPEWNNAYSLAQALPLHRQDTIVINGDTWFDHHLLPRFLHGCGHADVTLAIDRTRELTSEAMKVSLDATGGVLGVSKGVTREAEAEFVGVSLLACGALSRIQRQIDQTWQSDAGLYCEDAWHASLDGVLSVRGVDVSGSSWEEVDDLDDLLRARGLAKGSAHG